MNATEAQTQDGFYATWHNQFGRPLGSGIGLTREDATAKATKATTRELASANPNWKWRKQKLQIKPWKVKPSDLT